jgi:hypothetical protein
LELAEKQSSGAAGVIQICAAGVLTQGPFSSKLFSSGVRRHMPPRLPVTLRP